MPVLWGVFHSTRLVVITVKGAVRLKDMEDCVDGIMTAATLSYRKLVDMTAGTPALSREDIVALAGRAREHAGTGSMGALAIVVGSDEGAQQAWLFGSLSVADRPWKMFRDLQAARDWLIAQPAIAPRALLEDGPPDMPEQAA